MIIRGDDNVVQPLGTHEPIAKEKVGHTARRSDSSKTKESDEICPRGAIESSQDDHSLEEVASRMRNEIRERIESGFYRSENVIRKVAEKLLDLFGL